MRIITILLLCLSFLGYSQKLEASNHEKEGIPVTFDLCLSYGICSFNFTEDREVAKKMRFFHDKVVLRMVDLGNITFIEECNSAITFLKKVFVRVGRARLRAFYRREAREHCVCISREREFITSIKKSCLKSMII